MDCYGSIHRANKLARDYYFGVPISGHEEFILYKPIFNLWFNFLLIGYVKRSSQFGDSTK